MKDIDFIGRLGVTRARIEAAVSGASVLAVTSALRTDGSTFLAAGLAQSLCSVGHEVLLVRMGEGSTTDRTAPVRSRKADREVPVSVREGKSGEPDTLYLGWSGSPASYSLEAAQAAFARFRERYAFTIVDATVVLGNGTALSLARAADGVLIALEKGRSGREVDRELAKVLRAAGATTLGIVTIDRRAIKSFSGGSEPATLPLRGSRASAEEPLARTASVVSSG